VADQKVLLSGVYPGTFDPVTNGHMDIIVRAAKVLERLVVAVAHNSGKNPMFSLDERVEMIREDVADLQGLRATIEVRPFDNLLVHFCQQQRASVLVRGLRAVSDFEYEFQMAAMNARQDGDIETVFFMASEHHQFISSNFVKEIGRLGGNISSLVSAPVMARFNRKLSLLSS
jgi:pantetheine-phosphate adenylyltransferase